MERQAKRLRQKAATTVKAARLRAARRILRKFGRDEEGSMVVFTLFLILMMILMGGVAVDMMRFETNRTRLQGAIDRAVLAAADLDVCLDPSQDPIAVVRDYVARSGFAGQVGNIEVERGFNSCQVIADARIDVNTIFLAMVSVDQLGTPASSGATESLDEVEVSLVLDVSGSMGRDGKIEALRDAGADFVETVLDSIEEGHATISIVPYSEQVNLGPHLFAQYLTRYNHNYSYCIDLPSSHYLRTDLSPQTRYDQAAHFDAQSGYNSSRIRPASRFTCNPNPNAWVLPFEDDLAVLQAHIRNLQPDSWTSIEMGAKWGIALLDPRTQPVTQGLVSAGQVSAEYASRPLAYDTAESLKVMVLMTDGENTQDYVLSRNYRDQTSDVWYDGRDYTAQIQTTPLNEIAFRSDDRWYVDDVEYRDTDSDSRWNERYWVADRAPVSSSNEWWTNTRQGNRLTWQDLFAQMPIRDHAYHLRYDQYNNASTYYSWYDDLVTVTYTATKDARLAQICTAAKEEGIVIFAIGFQVTDRAAQVMSDCATSPNHFYRVANLDIASAFDSIANQISQLRLIR